MNRDRPMKIIFLSILLIVIAGIGLLAVSTLATPVLEPVIMLFVGTGLIGIARIVRSRTIES